MPPERDAPMPRDGDGALACPACAGRLYPRELACADCGLLVHTRYRANEFVELDDDDLHLLRIFIACEGRIRDMVRALGVSHPTVKTRLAALRATLGFEAPAATPPSPAAPAQERADILDRLEAGEIDFDAAMAQLKGQP